MPGKCVHCNAETKTRMNFVNANGIRFEYYSCMKGNCAVQSINSAFDKLKERGDQCISNGLPFELDQELVSLFS